MYVTRKAEAVAYCPIGSPAKKMFEDLANESSSSIESLREEDTQSFARRPNGALDGQKDDGADANFTKLAGISGVYVPPTKLGEKDPSSQGFFSPDTLNTIFACT